MPTVHKAMERGFKNMKHTGVSSVKNTRSKFAWAAVAALLGAAMAFSGLAVQAVYADNPGAAKGFVDVPTTHWAYENIKGMVTQKIVSGFPDGKFRPEDKVTKAQFNQMLTTAFCYNLAKSNTSKLSDLKTAAWAEGAINAAYEHNLIPHKYFEETTNPENNYRPNDNMEREEVAYETCFAIEDALGNKEDSVKEGALTFTDIDQISKEYAYAVNALVQNGTMKGYENGKFMPHGFVTRAEAAAIISRALHIATSNGYNVPKLVQPEQPETPVIEKPIAASPTYIDKSIVVRVEKGFGDTIYISTTVALPCDGTNRYLMGELDEQKAVFLPLYGDEEWGYPMLSLKEIDPEITTEMEEELIKKGIVKRSKGFEIEEHPGEIVYNYKHHFKYENARHVYMYSEIEGYSNIRLADYPISK